MGVSTCNMRLIRYWLTNVAMSSMYHLVGGLVLQGFVIFFYINPDTLDDYEEGTDAFNRTLGIAFGGSLALFFSGGEIRTGGC